MGEISEKQMLVTCPRCGGDGGDRYLCGTCQGQGKVTRAKRSKSHYPIYTQAEMDAALSTARAEGKAEQREVDAKVADAFRDRITEPHSTIMPTDHVRGQKYAAFEIAAAIRKGE